jgi:Zn-dependent protease with chaperone function
MSTKKPFPEAPVNVNLHKVKSGEYGNLMERVQEIAKSLDMEPPNIWVVDSPTVNMIAHPSNNVITTTAMILLLSDREHNALLAHELGHLKNKDHSQIKRLKDYLNGHLLEEYRELKADERSIEASYKSGEKTHSPDDFIYAMKKFGIASRKMPHSAGDLMGTSGNGLWGEITQIQFDIQHKIDHLPDGVRKTIYAISDTFNDILVAAHLNTHPSTEDRINNVIRLKKEHDKATQR